MATLLLLLLLQRQRCEAAAADADDETCWIKPVDVKDLPAYQGRPLTWSAEDIMTFVTPPHPPPYYHDLLVTNVFPAQPTLQRKGRGLPDLCND